MSSKKYYSILRLSLNGALAAVFFVLTFFSIRIGNSFKITFDSLAVVISSVLFGPVDGFIVGFIGAFLEQITGPYGITATTFLWVLAPALRGLVIGLGVKLFKNQMTVKYIWTNKKPYIYFVVCIVASVVTSLANTLALYIDSKLFNYYTYELVLGVLGIRIINGIATSVITALIALPILRGLVKAHLVPER